ncbi:MAG: DUF2442 domain-containing protein [Bacteroidota bacterium]|nr:DUF2442 domain-containing protein [Bacteroidota bacterium]
MKILKVWFDKEYLYVQINTGHIIGNPLNWFVRLKNATPEQRLKYEIGPFGESLHWEEIDEDLSLESLFDFERKLNYAKV